MKTYLHNKYHLDVAFIAIILSLLIFKLMPKNFNLKPENNREEIKMALLVGLVSSVAIYITEFSPLLS